MCTFINGFITKNSKKKCDGVRIYIYIIFSKDSSHDRMCM